MTTSARGASDDEIVGDVHTHADTHTAAVIDATGRLLADRTRTADACGYRALTAWMRGFGPLAVVAIEGTGVYRSGLAEHLRRERVEMAEVAADTASDGVPEVEAVLTSDVAAHLGRKPQSLSPARDALLEKGLIYSGERGLIAFTVPHFGRYLREQGTTRRARSGCAPSPDGSGAHPPVVS